MSFLRSTAALTISLASTLLFAGRVHATDVSMADGSVNFSTPLGGSANVDYTTNIVKAGVNYKF